MRAKSKRKTGLELSLICPVCLTQWGTMLDKKLGGLCGDWSQDQRRPCVGRLMPIADFEPAEWRTPYTREDGTPMRQTAPPEVDLRHMALFLDLIKRPWAHGECIVCWAEQVKQAAASFRKAWPRIRKYPLPLPADIADCLDGVCEYASTEASVNKHNEDCRKRVH